MSRRSDRSRSAPNRSLRFAARSFRPLSLPLLLLLAVAMGLAAFPALAQVPEPTADLGDAPDSTSHTPNAAMLAYPGTPANFPTVFDGPDPRGPRHAAAKTVRLGQAATAERDADQLPDEDQITNIDPAAAERSADRDGADDGWLNRQSTIIRDCAETVLRVGVSRNLDVAIPANRLFLNVWYDGNRDGDWADTRTCPDQQRVAFEWIVQNFPIDPAQLANGASNFGVPTFLVLDAPRSPEDVAPWVRFTLSEQPVPRLATGAPADGRGPPNGYALGETEDYRYERPTNTGEPGTLVIRKFTNLSLPAAVAPDQPSPTPLDLGDVFTYTLTLQHQPPPNAPNPGPLFARAVDQLPPNVELISGPRVNLDGETSAPFATFDPNEGPSGTVRWEGALAPGTFIGIEFTVRVRFCRPEQTQIRNVLEAFVGNVRQEAVNEVPLACRPPEEPPAGILTKRILVETANSGEPLVEVSLPPGEDVTYLLTLAPTANLNETLSISDTLPLGMVALEVDASQGVARIVDEGSTVLWEGRRSDEPTRIKIRARLTERVRCDDRLVNIAYWYTPFHRGPSNPAVLRLVCADLGDAPDGTNHPAKPMDAYVGVPASFPTVFDGVDPRGPKHLQPRPLHLGRGVSAEIEADLGPDVDGVNNIVPERNRADLDRFDDGVGLERVRFANCEPARIPVSVLAGPDLAALITGTQGQVYLNVWLDGNRDGDWADLQQCANTPNAPAREHIVVDYVIRLADLVPGMNPLVIPTSGPVPWPASLAERPAWLRVTLSERPANKTLPAGCAGNACTYGDGRGYADPFRFGETEDYFLLGRPGDGRADPSVRKRGTVVPGFGQDNQQSGWIVNWAVEYFNRGNGVAENVTLVDTLAGPQTRTEREVSAPPLTPIISGPSASYRPGFLLPGQAGFIGFQATVPFSVAPGTVLTNTVVISASNDIDPANNTAVISLTVPLLPPLIIDPISGDSCEGTLTVRGRAQPGSSVQLYVDDAASGSPILVPSGGSWEAALNLAAGEHTIYAVATQGGVSSAPSPTVAISVDPTLFWSPITLRFTDAAGHTFTPRDANGRASETGWRVWLRPNTAYTVSVKICCEDPNAVVTLEIPGVGEITLTESDTPNVYTGTFTTGDRTTIANGTFRICVTCNLIRRCSDGTVLIDPLGVVYDATKGIEAGLLAGATVACYEQIGGEDRLWPASDFGQVNPQTTLTNGFYSFYTPPGTYRLQVSRAGFHSFRSEGIVVTDAPVIYNVPLTPLPQRRADFTVYITENGFDPPILAVPNGSVIRWVNLTGGPRAIRGAAGGANALAQAGGWDSGLLNTSDSFALTLGANGTYTMTDPNNPTASGTLIVSNTRWLYMPLIAR